jgi:stage II sporulation protein GA (sporulation sigma-E factor processing peptidase)
VVQGVYVDILLTINFLVHLLLISLAGKICGTPQENRWRSALAALLGAMCSLTIFLPPLPALAEVLLKGGSTMLVVLVASRWRGAGVFVREWIVLMLVSTLFYGLMMLMQGFFAVSGMFVFGNAVYFHIQTPVFILCLAVSYAVVWLANRILQGMSHPDERYRLSLTIEGRQMDLVGFLDTGNHLSEPFSGAPVLVCGLDTAAKLFPAPVLDAVFGAENEYSSHVRQIPFSSVSGNGLMPAIRGEALVLTQGEEQFFCQNFYLAVSREQVGNGEWQVLLNRRVLDRGSPITKKGKVEKDECCEQQSL